MGWNGSGCKSSVGASVPLARNRKNNANSGRKGLFVGLIVVALGGAAAWWFFVGDGREAQSVPVQSIKDKTQSAITTIAPKISTSRVTAAREVANEKIAVRPATNQWGNPLHWGNKKLKPKNIIRLDRSKLALPDQIFPETANRDIAVLITLEPGTELLGSDEYDETFVRSFKESLKTPIIVTEDDSEEAADLKRAVNKVKIDLKARMDDGEDIAEIMTATRRELRELGAYREDVKSIIEEVVSKPETTKEDLDDVVNAANKMLEERALASF